MRQLQKDYHLPFDRSCKHEVCAVSQKTKAKGVRALDIAKDCWIMAFTLLQFISRLLSKKPDG